MTRSQTWNSEWPNMCSVSAYIRIYLKAKERRVWMRENDGSHNFNFISLSNPAQIDDKNWLCQHHLQLTSSWKMMLHMMFRSIQTFCERHIYWMFPLFFLSPQIDFFLFVVSPQRDFFLSFSSAHFTDHQLHSSYSIILALCALYTFFVPLMQNT